MNFLCKILECRLQLYRFMLKYYKILGLAPFDIHVTPSTQTDKPSQQFDINYTYSFEEAAYEFILSLCLFFKIIYDFLHQQTEQSYWHDYHLINNFNLMIIYFNYCSNQRQIAKIITNLTSLESELTEKSWDYSLKITCVKNYCVCLIIFFNINFITVIVYNIIFSTNNSVDLYFTISTLFLTGTFVFQYAFIMIHLYQRFKILNHSLLSLVNNQSSLDFIFGTNSFRNEATTEKLLFLRQAHRLLYEVNCDVTKFYSVPIFFAVLSYSPILVHYIRVLTTIEINNDIFVTINRYFDTSLWIIFSLLPIFTLTFFVTKAITEMKRTRDNVSKIIAVPSNRELLKDELEKFSIELLHRNFDITACGFFKIDNSLLNLIFTGTLIYCFSINNYQRQSEKKGIDFLNNQ